MTHLKTALGSAYVLFLSLALCFYGAIVYQQGGKIGIHEEFPSGCDAFGYLSMAQNIRAGHGFFIEDPQTEKLTRFLRSTQLPAKSWDEIVAPHAYHYFPGSEKVAPQYPPGTGLILSWFPEGKAVQFINQISAVILLLLGLGCLVWTAIRRDGLSAGIVGLATYWTLEIFHQIRGASFSINCMVLPLVFCIVLLFLGRKSENRQLSNARLFFAGCMLGLAVLVRLPVFLLYPGLFILSVIYSPPASRMKKILSPFHVGVFICGVLPILLHQQRMTGAWYLSTYGSGDNSLPDLTVLKSNLSYYLGHGPGAGHNWILFNLILGCIGLFWLRRKQNSIQTPTLHRMQFLTAVALTWGLSTLYFLTHRVQIWYYPIPETLAGVLMITGGVLTRGANSKAGARPPTQTRISLTFKNRDFCTILFFSLALLPGVLTFQHVNLMRSQWNATDDLIQREYRVPNELPNELKDPKAWIWANASTGTIWYYDRKAAYKIPFGTPELRLTIYRYVASLGEPQFIVHDSDEMAIYENEIAAWGGKLEPRGQMGKYPYFRVSWPIRF